jgi:hypothetical protein
LCAATGNNPGLGCVKTASQLVIGEIAVNGLIYLVGLVVVIIAVLSFFGMH